MGRKLSPNEIMEKLNRIPVFTIEDGKGNLFCATDTAAGTEPFIVWHSDPDMAREALAKARGKLSSGATLKPLPLGLIVAVNMGWAEVGAKYEFRLSATDLAMATYEKVNPGAKEEMEKQGGWVMPVFFVKRLDREDKVPVFINPEHAARAWAENASNRDDASEPLELTATDLLTLVRRMHTTEEEEWSTYAIMGSRAALELAKELGEGTAGPAAGGSEPASTEEQIKRKQQICAMLSEIPVFTLHDGNGGVLARPDDQGKPFIPWFLDGTMATETLRGARAVRATTKLLTQTRP